MRNATPRGHMIDLLFALALFCVFAASSLIVVVIGADVYRSTADGMKSNFSLNTALAYVTEKVRQNDAPGAVHIGELGGSRALILEQRLDGGDYRTYIYYADGALREIFTAAGNTVSAGDGQQIVALTGFDIEQAGGLCRFTATDEAGRTASTAVAPRCAGGAG